MRTITKDELKEILRLHLKYIIGESGGIRADLSGANLRWANLSEANLRWADLSGANLSGGTDIISVSGIGSARRMTTYHIQQDRVWCGCFTGTLAEFEAQVEKTHKDNPKHLSNYRNAIALLKGAKEAV